MCGIVAYKGRQKCLPFLLDGLKRLEYRGYDSAGVAYVVGNGIFVQKQAGSVIDLINSRIDFEMEAYTGIGHTRWATHGKPCHRNAHPHVTADDRLAIVHNGIVENYLTLKTELQEKGYMFRSDTDSEVLLYLIYDYLIQDTKSLLDATKLALERVEGAYAIVVIDKNLDNRHKLVIARKGSPLIVGIGPNENEFFVSSDVVALSGYVKDVVYLEDNVVGELSDTLKIYKMNSNEISSCNIEKLNHQLYDIEKGKYDHFMLKEIFEQPRCFNDCLAGRIDGYNIKLGGLMGYEDRFVKTNHITILACGSSWHAGLLAKYYIEEFCKIKVSVEYASEFKYRKPVISPDDIVIGISQSGETADTLNAIELAKQNRSMVVGICNCPNSSLTRITDCGIFIRSGAEIGVASTKAFMNQVLSLFLLSLWIDQIRGRSLCGEYRRALVDNIKGMDSIIEKTLLMNNDIQKISKKFAKSKNCLYLGRGYNFPIALEGALKLKEISYIHAEGYPAAEMKHGPIALIDKNMPVVVIDNNRKQHDKIVNNIREIQARGGKIITIYSGDEYEGDYGIKVPEILDALSVIPAVVVLQLFAYYCAVFRGCNIDKPRNLAKSVTVE